MGGCLDMYVVLWIFHYIYIKPKHLLTRLKTSEDPIENLLYDLQNKVLLRNPLVDLAMSV